MRTSKKGAGQPSAGLRPKIHEQPIRNTEREEFYGRLPAKDWEVFRKRPVEIRAARFDLVSRESPQGVCRCDDVPLGGQPHIHTLEGHHIVSDGDWVIQGIHGEFYPCKPDIFKETYEHVPRERAPRSAKREARSRPKSSPTPQSIRRART